MIGKTSILPIVSILLTLIGFASHAVFSTQALYAYFCWLLALSLFLAWLYKSTTSIKSFFSRKNAKYSTSSLISVVLVLVLIVGISFLSAKPRFNLSWDVTRDGFNTLSDQSVKVIEEIKKKSIKTKALAFFTSDEKKTEFKQKLNLYLNQGAVIDVEYIDPQADPTKAISENITTADTVLFKSDLNEARVTQFSEEKITNALIALSKTQEKSIYFVVGHGERSLNASDGEGYSLIRDELSSERYNVDELNLLESSIPDSADLIVITGPRYDFKEVEIHKLEKYLQEGKPLLVMIDAMVKLKNLSQMLEPYGIIARSDFVILRPDDPRTQLLGQNNAILTSFDDVAPPTREYASRSGVAIMVSDARSLELVEENTFNMDVISLAKTSEINIAVDNVSSPDDLKSIDSDRIREDIFTIAALSVGRVGGEKIAANNVDISKTDINQNIRNEEGMSSKELRLAVVGSSTLGSNLGVQRAENIDLFLNIINYLIRDESYISIRPKSDSSSKLDLSSAGSQFSLLFLSLIYPFIFLGLGIVHWMRRRQS